MDKKATAILSYFFGFVGWLIAYLAGDKEGAKFHLNQSLLVNILNVALGFILGCGAVLLAIPYVGIILYFLLAAAGSILALVCWILGLIAAVQQEEKEIPVLGKLKLLK